MRARPRATCSGLPAPRTRPWSHLICSALLCAALPLAPAAAAEPAAGRELSPSEDQAAEAIRLGLMETWSKRLQSSGLSNLEAWQQEMQLLMDGASLEALTRASSASSYVGLIAALQELRLDSESATEAALKLSVRSGLDPMAKALGDPDRDLVFVPVTPCRIIDTRVAGGPIAANTTRNFDITATSSYAAQGGSASDCNGVGSAGNFAAAAITLIAVTPSASGYLTAYPFNTSQPLSSTLNYTAGSVVANSTVVRLDQTASAFELSVYSFAQSHLVADIYGYYQAPPNTLQMSCVTTAEQVDSVAAGATRNTVAPACASGYTRVSTNCESSTWQMPFVYISDGVCSAQNNSSGTAQLRASANCCRVTF
ncbi:hypothetical protein [Aquimonas voraii]|uniref:Uncharacterized protein n=1 Tax=Aquimonas voraii TaxID=265719 RepID=A0A1G6VXY6_9GAMM|nr:hypothetical protein [Aquimonas voraii]SDD58394.1 hypothetical protein SAMN04488509_10413 [Aquimonas voraii]